jgi:hypothetical protein
MRTAFADLRQAQQVELGPGAGLRGSGGWRPRQVKRYTPEPEGGYWGMEPPTERPAGVTPGFNHIGPDSGRPRTRWTDDQDYFGFD